MLNYNNEFAGLIRSEPRIALQNDEHKNKLLPRLQDAISHVWARKSIVPNHKNLTRRRICAIGFSDKDSGALRSLIMPNESFYLYFVPVENLGACATSSPFPSHIIVNLDAFDSVDDAVDTLILFRRVHPEWPILAVSAFVSGDDLGCERRSICDATLRWPLSSKRFCAALSAAEEASFCGSRL